MENATKALLMAGGILIALLIIGALLLMFNNLSSYQDTNIKNEREAQVLEFNNQYETYIRKDVRGSDLYSLLNKVVDYNIRKSSVSSGTEGEDVQFEPMTVSFDFIKQENRKKLTYDGTNRIFTKNSYELTEKTSNDIKKQIDDRISGIETSIGASTSGLVNLTTGISNLFDKNSTMDQKGALNLWNRNSSNKISYIDNNSDDIRDKYKILSDYRDEICTYYEYMQFKRAHFDCIDNSVKYSKSGRIIKMEFKFNGTIE